MLSPGMAFLHYYRFQGKAKRITNPHATEKKSSLISLGFTSQTSMNASTIWSAAFEVGSQLQSVGLCRRVRCNVGRVILRDSPGKSVIVYVRGCIIWVSCILQHAGAECYLPPAILPTYVIARAVPVSRCRRRPSAYPLLCILSRPPPYHTPHTCLSAVDLHQVGNLKCRAVPLRLRGAQGTKCISRRSFDQSAVTILACRSPPSPRSAHMIHPSSSWFLSFFQQVAIRRPVPQS